MLQPLCLAMLKMGGQSAAEITLQWPQVLPTNRKEEADTAAALRDVGVSQDTVLTELGYDPEAEAEKRQSEVADVAELALKSFDAGQISATRR